MPDLDDFLKAAKSKGASDQFLVALLKEKGWPSKQIYESLERYYVEEGGVAIPESPSRLESAREAFFHLLAFATLGTWVFALGSTWFELINHWIPDLAMRATTIRRILACVASPGRCRRPSLPFLRLSSRPWRSFAIWRRIPTKRNPVFGGG